MPSGNKFICTECNNLYDEEDDSLGNELFCPECGGRLELGSSTQESPISIEPKKEPRDAKPKASERSGVHIFPITTLSNVNEMICFIEERAFYYYFVSSKAIGGTTLKNKQLKRIESGDYSKMDKINLQNCEVSLSDNVFAFYSTDTKKKFLLEGDKAITTAKAMLDKFSKYDNAVRGRRSINSSERFKQTLPLIGLTVFFAFVSIVIPFGITVEQDAYLVHIIMIPFIKIGVVWTLLLFLSITVICLISTLLSYSSSSSIETEYVKIV
jgi:hypothetical protein